MYLVDFCIPCIFVELLQPMYLVDFCSPMYLVDFCSHVSFGLLQPMYHLDFCSPYIFWTSAAHVSCGLLGPHVSCGLLEPMSHLDFCSPCIFWTSAAHASFGFLLDLRRLLHECGFQNGFQKPSENSIKNQPKRHQKPSETGRRKSWKQPKGVGNFKRFSYFQANGFLGFRTNRSSIFFNRRMPWVFLLLK